MNVKLRNLIAVVWAVGLMLPSAAGAQDPNTAEGQQKKPYFTLTVLHNNDGESKLINAGSGALVDFGGVARFSTVVENLRAEVGNSDRKAAAIMLSSGDNFLAGPQFNASLDKGIPFYDTIAMRLIGYDASAIGNSRI